MANKEGKMKNAMGIYPDQVFLNGQVITMDESRPAAKAVAVKWDRIAAVGSNQEILNLAGPDTQKVDFAGKTVMPGFIEPHNHFAHAGITTLLYADLQSPPLGQVKNVKDLIEALRERAGRTPRGKWILGRGYDDTLLAEQRHPTREDLDQVSKENPVWIVHTSGHLSVANTRALEIAGVTGSTPQPAGGVIRIDPKTGQPDGVLEEMPAQMLVSRYMPSLTLEQRLKGLALAAKQYLQMGVTSSYDAGVIFPRGDRTEIIAYQKAVSQGMLPIRITMMVGVDFLLGCGGDGPAFLTGFGDSRLRVGPAKIIVDGSIQGYTGWLAEPYHVPFKGDAAYRGYPVTSPDQLNPMVVKAHREGIQVASHGNGDAAIDAILDAYRLAQKEFPRADSRHRIEHCQMAREDQLDQMVELGVSPSFFVSHTFYWGDRHKSIFIGPERAMRISPLKTARKRGIRFSIHSDCPVTPVSPLFCVFAAVNRITRNGEVLGPEYRLTVEEALRTVTIDAAWQNFEEEIKGSIEVGKLADFTVLAENPLKVAPEKIKDIKIEGVFIGGRKVDSAQIG
jgi:predicted amidohydrolase YtcJ